DRVPHVSALITNLADEAALVDRMQAAVHGELVRRQELLRRAGNFSSVRDYEKARTEGAALDPLPTLFVVVDEFSELIAANPDFIQLFVMIGRLGRSLAVHLLLASQRLEDGRIHQLEGHLSYRIGLRTFSAMESRSVVRALVDRLVDQGPPAHQVWMAPLENPPTLDDVLPPLLPDPEDGLRPADVDPENFLRVPAGLIDKPFEQIRDLMVLDLSGVGG